MQLGVHDALIFVVWFKVEEMFVRVVAAAQKEDKIAVVGVL